ncbi:hypothetical protein QTP70_018846 [Hemibagrus guttatus]|uniref:Neuromedin-K n=1 Tax=Hemibagrus guttatus TaxID=175788 RepID=A0AAE0QE42_9TELE|nr:hypothetical protein QTP70_018846 [Hemibagrus guttatus]
MYRGLLLVFLILLVETRLSESSCAEEETQRSTSDESPSFRLAARNLLKRYHDIDYDSFVGLMGRRSADAADDQSQRKREMHDIFVGLMGRRNSEDDAIDCPLGKRDTRTHDGQCASVQNTNGNTVSLTQWKLD